MVTNLDSLDFKIKKLKNSLDVKSFQIIKDNIKEIYFERNLQYWRYLINLKKITRVEYFTILEKKLRECDCQLLNNKEILEKTLEIYFMQNLNNSEFKIFQFLDEFNLSYEKIITAISNLNNNKKIILTNPDETCGITYFQNIPELFQEIWNIKLPRKRDLQKNDSILWLPKEDNVKEFFTSNQILGYNLINLKKSLNIFNYCASAYISRTTHLFLKKLDLVIIISSRLYDT